MKVLVTGASGFIGSHLVDALLARGDEVTALQRTGSEPRERLSVRICDVLDAEGLRAAVADAEPDEVYHLAAQSLPTRSWSEPALTNRVNVEGTLNLFDALADRPCPIVVASSSAVYAPVDGVVALSEDSPLAPSTPYGVSKLAVEHFCRIYAAHRGLRIVRVRPFFLVGPRKTDDVCSDWARQLVEAERAGIRELRTGNLEVTRDFLHVADGVTGLLTVAAKGRAGEVYNVSSGRGVSLHDLAATFVSLVRIDISVARDGQAARRRVDEPYRVGDPARLTGLGWAPRFDLRRAVTDTLEYWRGALVSR